VRELYTTVLSSKAEGKMGNSSTLQLLNELEKEIEGFLFEFYIADTIDQDLVGKQSKAIT
jgi:hypothetical protein